MPLPKPCDKCGKRFKPCTRANKLCDKCRDDIIIKSTKKRELFYIKVKQDKNKDDKGNNNSN